MLHEINATEYLETVVPKKDDHVLVFHATWCGPCKMFKHTLDELSEKDNVNVYRIDIDKNIELAKEYKVNSIPHWFIIKNGEIVKQGLGYEPYPVFSQKVKEYLK
ncbi:thioredoxin family protein [Mycoplasmopsis gallinarum]|uniref:Thioredoxin n=1 Tax=Mycoplasmopsis gallinarum TaxID=29557 RepID=A0A168RHT1_9BACT|nr:thioredoxin family protein [Mycoplasmopsis gallinarum]OAB49001.1 Thioredoxin [Mycoplasmopsis gallinarum]